MNTKYRDNNIEINIEGALFSPIEDFARDYIEIGVEALSRLRGSYWGDLYDRRKDVRLVWNDHVGDKMVFYAESSHGLLYSTSLIQLANNIRKERRLRYDHSFLWSLLIYGYSPICHTIYEGIRRIPAGMYLCVEGKKWELKRYHRFSNKANNLSLEDNVKNLDLLFRQAVKRVLDYNACHNFLNYMPLSAGLDSRMSCRVAHELTCDPIINITFSQSGYYDETIPKELSAYWGNEWRFKKLDGGDFLMNVDDACRRTHGLTNYAGPAQVADSFDLIDSNRFGVVLTGMIGDVILNAHYSAEDAYSPYVIGEGAFVHRYMNRVEKSIKNEMEDFNKELGYIYIRGFYGANLGSPLIQQEKGESYSPFYDVDFLEYALSIPVEQRLNYRIYDQWILTCYPDMAQWPHNGIFQIGDRPILVSIMSRLIPLKDVPKRMCWYLLKRLHIANMYTSDESNSMNPEDLWIAANKPLRDYIDLYVSQNIEKIPDDDIRDVVETLNQGTFAERSQVVTLLAALKNFPL